MVNLTLNGFNDLADKDGSIVIYPDAIEGRWNEGMSLHKKILMTQWYHGKVAGLVVQKF